MTLWHNYNHFTTTNSYFGTLNILYVVHGLSSQQNRCTTSIFSIVCRDLFDLFWGLDYFLCGSRFEFTTKYVHNFRKIMLQFFLLIWSKTCKEVRNQIVWNACTWFPNIGTILKTRPSRWYKKTRPSEMEVSPYTCLINSKVDRVLLGRGGATISDEFSE